MDLKKPLKALKRGLESYQAFLTPLTVAIVGIVGSQVLSNRQGADTNARFYSELMSRRDDADNAVRKDMVSVVLAHFLDRIPAGLNERAMQLELLASNAQSSFDLKPLFDEFVREVSASSDPRTEEYRTRIKRVARSVVGLQLAALEGHSESFRRTIDLDELTKVGLAGMELDPETISLEGETKSLVKIRVLSVDLQSETLNIRFTVPTTKTEMRTVFDVGFYDFPSAGGIRLPNGTYCTVTLAAFSPATADIVVTCYPAAYSVIKDRPYFEEAVKQLREVSPRR